MTCRKSPRKTPGKLTFSAGLLALCAAVAFAGCGNYSNEDLEFQAALPERADLTADVPVRSAVVLGDTAELYRMSRNVGLVFNGITDAFLAVIDAIRAFPPTTRKPNLRIWGPFPADKQPGWMVEMVMERADVATFTYRLEFRPVGSNDPNAWISLFTGNYAVSGGVRRGMGHIDVNTENLRAAGVDPGLGYLDWLTVAYTTNMFPITVDLEFANLPNPLKPDDPSGGHYTYATQSNGQGALSYNFTGNIIPGIAGVDTVQVTARWLGTGEGRADLQVVMGDAQGAEEMQCWDNHFQAVYTYKPWSPLDNLGSPSDCAAIPTL